MRKAAISLVPSLIIGALIAGCGGDDDNGGGGELSTGDISKQEYIAQAEEICKESDKEFNAATESLDDPSKEEIVTAIEDDIVPITQDLVDQLRDLEAPKADVDELTALYDEFQAEIDALEADPEKFAGSTNPFEKAGEAFSDYGLDGCV